MATTIRFSGYCKNGSSLSLIGGSGLPSDRRDKISVHARGSFQPSCVWYLVERAVYFNSTSGRCCIQRASVSPVLRPSSLGLLNLNFRSILGVVFLFLGFCGTDARTFPVLDARAERKMGGERGRGLSVATFPPIGRDRRPGVGIMSWIDP